MKKLLEKLSKITQKISATCKNFFKTYKKTKITVLTSILLLLIGVPITRVIIHNVAMKDYKAFMQDVRHNGLPSSLSFTENAEIEGLTVAYNGKVYTSSRANGDILRTDILTGESETFAEGVGAGSESGWGLALDHRRERLYALKNGPAEEFVAFFEDSSSNPIGTTGRVEAYDTDTGELIGTWTLPEGSAGNDLVFDRRGRLYITDIAKGQILEVNTRTDEVSVWVESFLPFISGIVLGDHGKIYVHGGLDTLRLFRIDRAGKGLPGTPREISLSGLELQSGDGLAWGGRHTLYSTAGNAGVVRIVLDWRDNTGEVEELVSPNEGLTPTSLHVLNLRHQRYLFVNNNNGPLVSLAQGEIPIAPPEGEDTITSQDEASIAPFSVSIIPLANGWHDGHGKRGRGHGKHGRGHGHGHDDDHDKHEHDGDHNHRGEGHGRHSDASDHNNGGISHTKGKGLSFLHDKVHNIHNKVHGKIHGAIHGRSNAASEHN